MSYSTLHLQHRDETRKFIIGGPLLLVALFAFGLLLTHPAVSSNSGAAVSSTDSHKKMSTGASQATNQLSPLTLENTNLPVLTPASTVSTGGDSSSPVGASTVSPQTTRGSESSKNSNVQSDAVSLPGINSLIKRLDQ